MSRNQRGSSDRNILVGCICALGCEMLYGLSYLFTRTATEEASALALLGWRFAVAFIVMSTLVALNVIKIDLKGKSRRPLLQVALFSPVLYFIGETYGISHTTASESGVFLASIPVASLLASKFILHKDPTKHQVIGILITLAGVMVTVCAVGMSSSLSLTGYAFLLLAVISYALYCVQVDKASEYTGAEITYIMLAAGTIVFMILAITEALHDGNFLDLIKLPIQSPAFTSAILYQGIACSILAFFMSNIAIARIGVNRTASFIGVSTVVSIMAGAFILGETFTPGQLLGAVLILIGVYTANGKKSNE